MMSSFVGSGVPDQFHEVMYAAEMSWVSSEFSDSAACAAIEKADSNMMRETNSARVFFTLNHP